MSDDPNECSLSLRQRQVLDAAATLANPGDPVTPSEIGRMLSLTGNNVSLIIRALKQKGLWKYSSGRTRTRADDLTELFPAKANPRHEEKAATMIYNLLLRFPDGLSRRRIIGDVARRMTTGS